MSRTLRSEFIEGCVSINSVHSYLSSSGLSKAAKIEELHAEAKEFLQREPASKLEILQNALENNAHYFNMAS